MSELSSYSCQGHGPGQTVKVKSNYSSEVFSCSGTGGRDFDWGGKSSGSGQQEELELGWGAQLWNTSVYRTLIQASYF